MRGDGAEIDTNLSKEKNLSEVLDNLPSGGGGSAVVRQIGNENRAVAVQVGGYGNRMLTEQVGDRNRALHLQVGADNDTRLGQYGDDNTNALVARDGVAGPGGGTFFLDIRGSGVDGFSIDATGPQAYRGYTVSPNGTGGLNITAHQ
mgnify:CR=1 FL=1